MKSGKVPKPKKNDKRRYVFYILLIIVVAAFIISDYGYFQAFTDEDVEITKIEYADIKDAGFDSWESYCSECGDNCTQRLDFEISYPHFEEWEFFPFDREYHCIKILDGVNHYEQEGIYFGVTKRSFSSLEHLDPREFHEFTICCGVETYDFAQKLAELVGVFSEENFFYQACKTREIPKKC